MFLHVKPNNMLITCNYMTITTVNITTEYLAKLGTIAKRDKRSKTKCVEIMIDQALGDESN